MKSKKTFLLFALFYRGNAFSQAIEIKLFPYTFTANKIKFRLTELLDSLNDRSYVIERFDKKWQVTDTIEIENEGHGNLFLTDVNSDGYIDIVYPEKWKEANIFLYNPIQNLFINSGGFYLAENSYDSVSIKLVCKNIFYDHAKGLLNNGYTSESHLFQIKNYVRINLGSLSFRHVEEGSNDAGHEKVFIYKINAGDDDGNFKLIKSINLKGETEFDYDKYWKANWQSFLRK